MQRPLRSVKLNIVVCLLSFERSIHKSFTVRGSISISWELAWSARSCVAIDLWSCGEQLDRFLRNGMTIWDAFVYCFDSVKNAQVFTSQI